MRFGDTRWLWACAIIESFCWLNWFESDDNDELVDVLLHELSCNMFSIWLFRLMSFGGNGGGVWLISASLHVPLSRWSSHGEDRPLKITTLTFLFDFSTSVFPLSQDEPSDMVSTSFWSSLKFLSTRIAFCTKMKSLRSDEFWFIDISDSKRALFRYLGLNLNIYMAIALRMRIRRKLC